MTSDSILFDALRKWAGDAKVAWAQHAHMNIQEPAHKNGGLVIDMDFGHTVAQVILWASGMLDASVLSTNPNDEELNEHHEFMDVGELALALEHIEATIRAYERRVP
jgi:hypothetical protein